MADEARLIAAFLVGLAGTLAVTPVAIALATRTDFHDRPVGYKHHARPTPYLGGAAVVGGFLLAGGVLGSDFARLAPLVGCACLLWLLGTLDDRFGLPRWPRVVAEAAAGAALWTSGLGWELFDSEVANLALTVAWTLAIVNAFNLIDNMDGAAATLGLATAIPVGVLALVEGDVAVAVIAFALAGACAGFLPYNLTSPARIFLGDGGSLPIGFLVAGTLMALPGGDDLGPARLLAAALLAGLPLVDTCLVVISRRRAGISILTGGTDHLTHRLRTRLGDARTVALTLGVAQAALGAAAIGVIQLGQGSVLVAGSIWFVIATCAIVLLETSSWAPARPPRANAPATARAADGPGPGPSFVEGLVIVLLGIACGLSPFLYGFYDVGVWGPIALGTLAVLLGLLIARPAVPRATALVAVAALAAMWLWALLSTGWAESADQAMTEANRWLLYAAVFGVLVLLLRHDALGLLLIGAGTVAILALAGYVTVAMLAGSGEELFLRGRLHEPLGYANGQAGYLLLGVWPLVAAAERVRRPALSGLAVAGATLLVSVVLLGQTRAVVPAALLSALLLLLFVRGRAKRGWVLLVIAAGVAASLAPVLEVYNSLEGERRGSDPALREAAAAMLVTAGAAGLAWAFGTTFVGRLGRNGRWDGALAAGRWVPLAAVVAAAAVAMAAADPVGKIDREARAFTELRRDVPGSTRFASGSGNRYDYWRVAWRQFTDHPLRGIGAGNYDRTYFLERRTSEDVRQAHSIELQALGELGIVGGLILAAFAIAILSGFVRHARAARESSRSNALAVAAGGVFLVWLAHTSLDWLHLIPGITGIALCAGAALTGPWRRAAAAATWRQILVRVACALAVVAGAVLVGRTALAHRYLEDGRAELREDPVRALELARDSIALNDEALPAYYLRSAGWARLGDYRRARAALGDAARREPHDYVTWALLGDLATRRGDRQQAHRDYAKARSLNPRDPILRAMARGRRE